MIALVDDREPDHESCLAIVKGQRDPLLTTWPALTEAMHLVLAAAGWPGQLRLWHMIERELLEIEDLGPESLRRIRVLMERYSDVPMALADASLVAVAELRGMRQVFTLDSDFQIYRLHGRSAFEVLPGR